MLTPEGFGYWSLLHATARITILVGGLGIATGLLKCLSDARYASQKASLPATALVGALASSVLAAGLLFVGADAFATVFLDNPELRYLVYLLSVYVCLKIIAEVPMSVLRVKERPGFLSLRT